MNSADAGPLVSIFANALHLADEVAPALTPDLDGRSLGAIGQSISRRLRELHEQLERVPTIEGIPADVMDCLRALALIVRGTRTDCVAYGDVALHLARSDMRAVSFKGWKGIVRDKPENQNLLAWVDDPVLAHNVASVDTAGTAANAKRQILRESLLTKLKMLRSTVDTTTIATTGGRRIAGIAEAKLLSAATAEVQDELLAYQMWAMRNLTVVGETSGVQLATGSLPNVDSATILNVMSIVTFPADDQTREPGWPWRWRPNELVSAEIIERIDLELRRLLPSDNLGNSNAPRGGRDAEPSHDARRPDSDNAISQNFGGGAGQQATEDADAKRSNGEQTISQNWEVLIDVFRDAVQATKGYLADVARNRSATWPQKEFDAACAVPAERRREIEGRAEKPAGWLNELLEDLLQADRQHHAEDCFAFAKKLEVYEDALYRTRRQTIHTPEPKPAVVDPTGPAEDAAAKEPAKRRGRRMADEKTVRYEADLAARWEQARDAEVYKGTFARDNGMTISDLDALLDRVAARKRRSDKNRPK